MHEPMNMKKKSVSSNDARISRTEIRIPRPTSSKHCWIWHPFGHETIFTKSLLCVSWHEVHGLKGGKTCEPLVLR